MQIAKEFFGKYKGIKYSNFNTGHPAIPLPGISTEISLQIHEKENSIINNGRSSNRNTNLPLLPQPYIRIGLIIDSSKLLFLFFSHFNLKIKIDSGRIKFGRIKFDYFRSTGYRSIFKHSQNIHKQLVKRNWHDNNFRKI